MMKQSLSLLLIFTLAACSNDRPAEPSAEKRPVELELHGDVRVDDYYWLRERENPEVIAYLEAENAYMEKALEPFMGLQKVLYDEMKSRIRQDDESAPYRRGDYFYYYRYVEGEEYPIYARKKGSLDAPEEVMLDV
ncbi:MAG: S9 family peptidase, partial [Woeseiaceae bacterium]